MHFNVNQSPFKGLWAFCASAVVFSLVLTTVGCTTRTENVKPFEKPALDRQALEDDFAFPSRPPRLSEGKALFRQKCAQYPVAQGDLNAIRTVTPIDMYLSIAHGEHGCSKDMTRDQRWSIVFYIRYLAGESATKNPTIAAIFGANCAVCHGTRGKGDGPLYTGHASAHELGMAPHKNAFYPPPANFTDYGRFYNRTNEWLAKAISEGVYPSAMPPWKGRVDKDKGFSFDDSLILDLVKYVRSLSYENDLPDNEKMGPQPLSLKLSQADAAAGRH